MRGLLNAPVHCCLSLVHYSALVSIKNDKRAVLHPVVIDHSSTKTGAVADPGFLFPVASPRTTFYSPMSLRAQPFMIRIPISRDSSANRAEKIK
jgi:hypothetical protein